MTRLDAEALLDQPSLQPSELIELEQLVTRTLRTDARLRREPTSSLVRPSRLSGVGERSDEHSSIVLCQAEAITLLESVARSVAGPGNRVLNVVTGPYGALFGRWLRETGAEVIDLAPGYRNPLTPGMFSRAVEGVDTVAVVQAEAATGVSLDLPSFLAFTREAGVLTVVDAVAAIGAEPIAVDDWAIDVSVIGGQKALAGPAGVSAAAISDRAWSRIEANPVAPRASALSLLDWRDRWLCTDRSRVPGTPSVLETRGLLGALRRVHSEGIGAVETRHRRASAATVAGVVALGLQPWAPVGRRAPICTTVALPVPTPPALTELIRSGSLIGPGDGPLADELFRINHFGQSANLDVLLDGLNQLGKALEAQHQWDDVRKAAADAWEAAQ